LGSVGGLLFVLLVVFTIHRRSFRRNAQRNVRVFLSHAKHEQSTEDRAIWAADALDAAGYSAWFDRTSLAIIDKASLREAVLGSDLLVTIIDPFTFDSEWVQLENRWAMEMGIPIVPLYDGDRYRWGDISKWRNSHPHVFKFQAVVVTRDFRTESHAKLITAIQIAERFNKLDRAERRRFMSGENAHVGEADTIEVDPLEVPWPPSPKVTGRHVR